MYSPNNDTFKLYQTIHKMYMTLILSKVKELVDKNNSEINEYTLLMYNCSQFMH